VRAVATSDGRFANMIAHIKPTHASHHAAPTAARPAMRAAAATLMLLLLSFGALFHGAVLTPQPLSASTSLVRYARAIRLLRSSLKALLRWP
jgi:hypothetical protein